MASKEGLSLFSARVDWIEGKNSLGREPEEQQSSCGVFIVEREGGSGRLKVTNADLDFLTRFAVVDDEDLGLERKEPFTSDFNKLVN